MTQEDFQHLLRYWSTGEKEAFDRFAARARPELKKRARMLIRDDGEAEDAVQEVLLHLFGLPEPGYDPELPWSPWFFQIVRRKFVDRLRRNGRVPITLESREGSSPADQLQGRETSPPEQIVACEERDEELAEGRRRASEVLNGLNILCSRDRFPFYLVDTNFRTLDDTAMRLRIPKKQLSQQLSHAAARVETHLRQRGQCIDALERGTTPRNLIKSAFQWTLDQVLHFLDELPQSDTFAVLSPDVQPFEEVRGVIRHIRRTLQSACYEFEDGWEVWVLAAASLASRRCIDHSPLLPGGQP